MKFGAFEIIPFVEQSFKLDGGSMYGVVPKKIWSRFIESDENNMIPMDTNLFAVKANGKNILLDTGFGDAISENELKMYSVTRETKIESGLKEIGLSSDDINIVFLTHLHTDHAGGTVKLDGDKFVPRFKNAKYLVQKIEWNDAMNPNERTAAVYIPERLKVLEEAEQLELLDGDTEFFPGLKAVITAGHTPGHQAIEMTSDDITVVYYADIVPSSHHIRVPYVAAVDLDPLTTMNVKRRLVDFLLEGERYIVFDHDIEIKIGHLRQDGKKVLVDKVEA
ncbi:MAG: MBL fold metallo-hydrolase [Candidatus Zixiibacteriota bacterium]